MRARRLIAWFPVVWTLTMGAWFVLYHQTQATCGPEIQRDCSIGLSVTNGLGRPGIIMLWGLGVAAYAVSSLTDRRRRSRGAQRPRRARRRRLAAVAVPAIVLAMAVGVALPFSTRPTPGISPVTTEVVDVRVVSAILHPSASSAGRNRHAARVSVHVLLNNRGTRRVSTQPKLLSSDEALPYDRRQFVLGPLLPGAAVDATLRFEPRSTFTQRLISEPDARLQIAGRTIALTIKIGAPVRKSPRRGVPVPSKTRRAGPRRPPRVARARVRKAVPRPARPLAPPRPPRVNRPPPPPLPRPAPPPPRRPPTSDKEGSPGMSFDDSG